MVRSTHPAGVWNVVWELRSDSGVFSLGFRGLGV